MLRPGCRCFGQKKAVELNVVFKLQDLLAHAQTPICASTDCLNVDASLSGVYCGTASLPACFRGKAEYANETARDGAAANR